MTTEPLFAEDEPTIRMVSVNHGYVSGDHVLGDINMELTSGSFTFLTGPSGSGKTTLLQLLYAAQKPRMGLVRLFGVPTSTAHRKTLTRLRRRIGVVYQDFRLLDHLTAYENAALPLRVTGKLEKDYRDDVLELLHWVGLGDRVNAKPTTLSGGEQQRVTIARALANRPLLLLADEPTGNLDQENAKSVFDALMAAVRDTGLAALIATHNLDLAARMDRHVALDNGILTEQS